MMGRSIEVFPQWMRLYVDLLKALMEYLVIAALKAL